MLRAAVGRLAAVTPIVLALIAALTPQPGLADDGATAAPPSPSVRIAWTDTPPVIDGVPDDAVWESAAVVDDFQQITPVSGAVPTQRTVVRILTDQSTLYLAAYCYDDDPGGIVANRMSRDAVVFYDDRFQVVLDTFHDRQNGILFEITPVGARRDVLIEGEAFSIPWDTIWQGRTSRDSRGWYAEIAIPYQSLNYDQEADVWGINFARDVRRNGERIRWADPAPQRFLNDLGNAGTIEGMRGVGSALGLDVVPAMALSYENGFVAESNPTPPPDELAAKVDDFEALPSGDIFYKVLPSLTATLTANTNFGETEADTRQVNFSRFAIAFPEKRDFFLQDALIFEFAELTNDATGTPSNGQPFQSRRIGIAQPDPDELRFEQGEILFGGKLAGRVGPVKLGLLHTLVDELGGVSRQNLTVARGAVNVLRESSLGMIVTNGDPDGRIDNTLVGADFLYRNSVFRGDESLTGRLWFQRSFSSDRSGDEFAWAAGVSYPNDLRFWRLDFLEIGEGFNPALGFVNRSDIRRYEGEYRYRIRRPGYIRTIDFELLGNLTTDRSDRPESGLLRVTPLQYENVYGGFVDFRAQYRFERPTFDFTLPGGLDVSAGTYHWADGQVELRGSKNWPLTASLILGGGQFFDGERVYATPRVEWRPSEHFLLDLRYELRQTWLPQESGATHLVVGEIAFFFTPDISWRTLVQYDNVSDSVGINSRLRWIVEDGREIFVILNQGAEIIDGEWRRGVTQPFAKIAWTFRF